MIVVTIAEGFDKEPLRKRISQRLLRLPFALIFRFVVPSLLN